MKKKEYLLRNRIIGAVLAAVLAQSFLFGVMLFSLGGFSTLSRQPYETMRVRLADRSETISSVMSNIYLAGKGLKMQGRESADDADVHTLLIDVLNKAESLKGIAYVGADGDDGIYYIDSEPEEYSVDASDIACLRGNSLSSVPVSLSNKWKLKIDEARYEDLQELAERGDDADGWFYDDDTGDIYYVIYVGGDNAAAWHLVLMLIDGDNLNRKLDVGVDADVSMQFWLGCGDGTFYALDEERLPVMAFGDIQDGMEQISWSDGKEEYTGYRSKVKCYGNFHGDFALYVEVLSETSQVQAPFMTLMREILIAYLFSICVCLAACWCATEIVLQPLKKLLEDIRGQKGRDIHFQDSRAVEIQSIYSALNDMAERLEESYSRYNFTMEEVEDTMGSFIYHADSGMTEISPSVEKILCIPAEYLNEKRQMSVEDWNHIRARLTFAPELNAYTFTDEGDIHCVSFKAKEEENGTFGVVMNKTAEYQKISQLQFVSEHDFLTKLHNAAYVKQYGNKLLKKHAGKVNAVLFCDLDNLKRVNDCYGHSMGDQYIIAMAERLRGCAEELHKRNPHTDMITARMSGDEFAMLLFGFSSREAIRDAALTLYSRKCCIAVSDSQEYPVRVSIGLAYEEKNIDTIDMLLKCADSAMYSIKNQGKNGIAIYVDEAHTEKIEAEDKA